LDRVAFGLLYFKKKLKIMAISNLELSQLIIQTATLYVGQKEQGKGNSGFLDKNFEAKLKRVGWEKSQPWCSYFAEVVYRDTYEKLMLDDPKDKIVEQRLNEVCTLFSGGTLQTLANFDKSKYWRTRETIPEVGAIIVFQKGNSWEGHIGIVKEVDLNKMEVTTIEGNTSSTGSRDGDIVAIKKRKLSLKFKADTLFIKGFIQPANPYAVKKEAYAPFEVKDKILS
jgi:CHAP domain